MRIELDYDPATGSVRRPDTSVIFATYPGLEVFAVTKGERPADFVERAIRLKAAGFSADEVRALLVQEGR